MTSRDLFDEGLQPERTHLAWQRTLLAAGVGCALAARFTAGHLGVAGIVAALAGLALVVVAYSAVQLRYRRITRSLRETQTLSQVSAWPLALVALAVTILAVLACAFIVRGA